MMTEQEILKSLKDAGIEYTFLGASDTLHAVRRDPRQSGSTAMVAITDYATFDVGAVAAELDRQTAANRKGTRGRIARERRQS